MSRIGYMISYFAAIARIMKIEDYAVVKTKKVNHQRNQMIRITNQKTKTILKTFRK